MTTPVRHVITSKLLSAIVSVPDGDPPSGGWPLLCFLHGYDEAHPVELASGVTRHGPLRKGNSSTVAARFIIVAPQLPLAGDIWIRFADAVRDVVDQVEREERADPMRRYLSGFSFGGNGVFDLALVQPEQWSALWPADPTRVPPTDPDLPVWLSLGQISRRLRERYVDQLQLEPASEQLSEPRVYLDEGQDHVGSARLAYQDERIYHWLLQWRRGTRT